MEITLQAEVHGPNDRRVLMKAEDYQTAAPANKPSTATTEPSGSLNGADSPAPRRMCST